MTVHTTDLHQALGEFQVDLDWSSEMAHLTRLREADGVTRRYPHLRLYRGSELRYGGVLLHRPSCNRRGITLKGHSFRWLLGSDAVCVPILDRTYWSGRQKLSNGSFEFLWGSWDRQEDSLWDLTLLGAGAADGSIVAAMPGIPTDDDVLRSTESWEVRQGERYFLVVSAYRGFAGTLGRLRFRIVFSGRFQHPQLIPNGDFEAGPGATWVGFYGRAGNEVDIAQTSAPIGIVYRPDKALDGGNWVMQFNAIPREQGVFNGDFESGLTAWNTLAGSWYSETTTPIEGVGSLSITAPAPYAEIQNYANPGPPPGTGFYRVEPGSQWRVEGLVRAMPGSDGEGGLEVLLHTTDYVLTPSFNPGHSSWQDGMIRADDNVAAAGRPRTVTVDINVPEAEETWSVDGLVVNALVRGCTVGTWTFERVRMWRMRGNVSHADTAPIVVTPERNYRITAPVLFDPSPNPGTGSLRLTVRLSGEGRPDVVVDGSPVDDDRARPGEDDGPKELSIDFAPPSGYDSAVVSVVAMDLTAPAYVSHLDMRESDATTKIFETKTGVAWASWTPAGVIGETPAGAHTMHVELIAEAGAQGWLTDKAVIQIIDQPILTGAQIAADLLLNPATGSPVLPFGRIFGTDTINADWRLKYAPQADALAKLARSGLLQPTREDRVNWDGTYDFGLAEEIYDDRGPDHPSPVVLRGDAYEVLDPIDTDESNSEAADGVLLVGADHIGPDGINRPTTGSAVNPTSGTDFFGNPLVRVRLAQDASIEHQPHADAFAAYLAAKELPAPVLTRIRLADPEAKFRPVRAGEWIYLWAADAGIEGDSPLLDRGEVILPDRKRVTSVDTDYGPSHSVTIFDPVTGEEVPLKGVHWAEEDNVELEVGEWRRDFVDDSDIGSAEAQFFRYRAAQLRP